MDIHFFDIFEKRSLLSANLGKLLLPGYCPFHISTDNVIPTLVILFRHQTYFYDSGIFQKNCPVIVNQMSKESPCIVNHIIS